jgi:putative heme-binding domain-containing protein
MKRAFIFLFFVSVFTAAEPMWIWKQGKITTEKAEFRRIISLTHTPKQASIMITCDNSFTLILNGKELAKSKNWQAPVKMDLVKKLQKGKNIFEVMVENEGPMAGLILDLMIDGKAYFSDKSWQARAPKGQWEAAIELKKYGSKPWGKVFNKSVAIEQSSKAAVVKSPEYLPLTTLPGFKAEKIYDVDKATQGSWVGLTSDNKDRLIASDQYGGIYRLTLGAKEPKVEKLNVQVSRAHGLLYAFDSLYVISSQSKMKGLYRLTDTNGDDQFDKEEYVIPFRASGEHGIHSVVLSPDKKSLYLIGGNNTDLPKSVNKFRMATNWSEDHILPRMDDGRGHNRGRLAPGGLIIKTTPDGKEQELIAHGFRNQFDVSFNQEGELFTFDADMEYDIGSPWYRPARINHVVSGADYGWRHGSGKWPEYYTDTVATTLDIGPSSPTGSVMGTGAKFPEKYQRSFFVNDWTYGTMYAVHLEQYGATYKATKEEFVSGKPLPLTDVIIHTDGNMYFLVGGRKTDSALYTVTYTGKESTKPAQIHQLNKDILLRRELEALHTLPASKGIADKAWPYLSNSDRFIRHAARVAIERQNTADWKSKFNDESNSWAIIEGACALARMGEKADQSLVLKKLNQVDYAKLSENQKLAAIRSYQLAFTRLGKPTDADTQAVIKKLDAFYPSKINFENRELVQVLLYLDAANIIPRAVREMVSATEEQKKLLSDEILQRNDRYAAAAKRTEQFRPNTQQMALAFSLRSIKNAWTDADYATYFSWFPKAKTWQGGNSFSIFIENSRKEALANIEDPVKKAKYDKISSKSLIKPRAITSPKGPGQIWTVETAVAAVQDKLKARDFKSGENLYHAVACASCHRFAGSGSGIGPDLTGSSSRYTLKDMMENIIEPSKVISDQYSSKVFKMKGGSEVVGRKGTEEDGTLHLMTNPYSADYSAEIKVADIKSEKEWHVSPMPPALIYSLNPDELSDLIAYIFSAGNPEHKYFKAGNTLEGAQDLFNGKDLSDWKGDLKHWKVENGMIYGSTHGNKLKANTFLVWDGEVEDFHLKWEAKFEGNNSGMMYRAFWKDESIYRLSGYQADMHPKPEFLAMLYGEGLGKRGIIAKRGQKVEIDANQKVRVRGKTTAPEKIDVTQWQTYEVICKGNRMIHKINGKVTVDITDNHPERLAKGMIGMQLHAGAPMKVWFKNIQLKKLN